MINVANDKTEGLAVVSAICKKDKLVNRAKILEWEDVARKMPQVDIPVKHTMHGGMYAREITIPKGTVLTGDIYKFDHLDIMVSGDITVSTDGKEPARLTGFNFLSGLSGKKRAGFAHEDTRWITIHPIVGNTGDEVQSLITAASFEELSGFNSSVNKADYALFVSEIGMTQYQIDKQVYNSDDMLEGGHSLNNEQGLSIRRSEIDGKGIFAERPFSKGEMICFARAGGERTSYGRYTNHALFPNARVNLEADSVVFIAEKDISESEEITVNYRELLSSRALAGDLCQE